MTPDAIREFAGSTRLIQMETFAKWPLDQLETCLPFSPVLLYEMNTFLS
jgi:hypothetical protein